MILNNTEKSNAIIKISNNQTIDNDKDILENIVDGVFYQNNGKYYIMYKENNDGEQTSSMIKVDNDTVTIKRSGAYNLTIICKEDNKHSFVYRMPYGDLDMIAHTKSVSISLGEKGGILKLKYTLSVNNESYLNDMMITVQKK